MADLIQTLRTTASVRDFLPEPVADDAIARILDTARFAPSGGNRQGWRVIVVRDEAKRRTLGEMYRLGWRRSEEHAADAANGFVSNGRPKPKRARTRK